MKASPTKKNIVQSFHECHAVTTRTMNTTWWPWDSHGEIKRFPLGECPIWPAPHHKRFLVVSPWRSLCYHEESRGLTMRFFWSPREIFWWIKIFTYPHQKLPRGLAVRFSLSPQGISRSHREILLVTTRNLLVNVSKRSWEVADDEVSSLFFHRLRICCWLEGQLSDRSCFEQWKMCGNSMVFFFSLYKDLQFSDSFWMVDAMLAAWPQYLLHLQEVVLPLQLLDTVHLKVNHQPLHDHLIELWIS